MTLLEYLKNILDRIDDIIQDSGNDGATIADYEEEVKFLNDEITRLESDKMQIKSFKIGKAYTMGLPNYSSVKVNLEYDVNLGGNDDLDEIQALMFAKLDDDLREELKKSNRKEGK